MFSRYRENISKNVLPAAVGVKALIDPYGDFSGISGRSCHGVVEGTDLARDEDGETSDDDDNESQDFS